jgi:hypothetical protein
MAKSPPSEQELASDYAAGVAAKASKWLRRTLAATGVADAAKSEAAESSYAQAMSAAIANKQRQKGLAGVSDSDIKAGVNAAGAGGYSQGATRKAAKMAKKAKPYVDEAVRIANSLPPRGADAASNVTSRVIPIAVGLQQKKRGGT